MYKGVEIIDSAGIIRECSVKCVKINLKLQKQLQTQPQSLKTKTCNRLIFRLLKNFFYVKEKFEIARLLSDKFLRLNLRLKKTKSRTVPIIR